MIKEKAYAKLNLNLHIISKKFKNGLFPVRFVNCQINLFDELSFKQAKNNIEVICPGIGLKKEKNLVYKAAVLLKMLSGNDDLGASIYLKKNIPVKAGLAGGSTDAAAAIIGLSKLWKIKLSKVQLKFMAGQLGKDVHYCLQGGLCEVEADGSKIIPLKYMLPKLWLVIIVPDEKKPSTAWMYNNLDVKEIGNNQFKIKKIKQAIKSRNKKEIINNLQNDFETTAINYYPKIINIKNDLIRNNAQNTLMAGSGLSIIGFFISKKEAAKAFNSLKVRYKNIFYASTK